MATSIRIGTWVDAPRTAIRPTFAIGDIHGCDDLLAALVDAITKLIAEDALQDTLVVFLGDYIDRGNRSLDALKRVLDLQSNAGWEVVCLPGNHEQLLRSFLSSDGADRKRIFHVWSRNGGSALIQELGFQCNEDSLDLLANRIVQSLGPERFEKFSRLPNHLRLGDYLFVHAGIHPEIGLSMLDRDWGHLPAIGVDADTDPLWVRGPFLTYEADHEQGVVVIHGHTPRKEVELRANRIGIDTGAYATGRLSAVQLVGTRLRFLQASTRTQGSSWLRHLLPWKRSP
jgi:serine/threonine protein phosphatase 1